MRDNDFQTVRCRLPDSSEAAYKLGSYIDELYPEARWKATRGIGNPLRHQYDRISDREIWDGVLQTLPAIRQSAVTEIARLESAEQAPIAANAPSSPETMQ